MASFKYTFQSGDTLTPARLNDARSVSDIVNADIAAAAAIAATKLASDSITNTQIKSNAAIAGTKIAPNFGSQNVVTTGTLSGGSATLTSNSAALTLVNSGAAADQKNWDFVTSATTLQVRARNDAGAGGGNTFDFTRSNEQVNEFSGSSSGIKWFVVDNANARVGINKTTPGDRLDVDGFINTSEAYKVDGVGVVSNRRTGWAAPTGTATRTAFATSTVTTAELAERVKALIDDLAQHGLIGT